LVYAYPTDGADRIGELASAMQTDAETIDAWWRSQDGTRTPRFDTFGFDCGAQLDISDVKLPQSGAELTPYDGRFPRILSGIRAAGLASPHEVYLVYYDGPDDSSHVCGVGGTSDPANGPGLAVVFTSACSSVPTSVIAAHELTHALGAVTAPAPHNCPSPDQGHVCDSNRDLMYPTADGSALSALTLDVGHDDYYGASGVGFDVRTSRWLRHLDAAQAHLSVRLTGAGEVASDVPGIDCTVSCESDWDGGQSVTLSATPAQGMRFVRWSGGCAGQTECVLTLASPTAVTALFAPQTYLLTVGVQGRGVILNSANPNACLKRCRLSLTSYQAVSLRAVARPGWRFKRWVGSCHGTRATCRLPMTASVSASAQFVRRAKPSA
jgi:hypothetical protein